MTTARPAIDTIQRRARLGVRHCLAPSARATSVTEAARAVVGLHGTDPASVYLSANARVPAPDFAALDAALYESRQLVRVLCMRRTIFVIPVESLPTVQAACGDAVAANQRRLLVQLLEEAGMAEDVPAWIGALGQETIAALSARGEALATELSADVPDLKRQFLFGEGKKWEGWQSVASRLLNVLGAEGHIIRTRPRGSWVSTQYRWAATGTWLGEQPVRMTTAAARADLARQWLARFGPATVNDLKWWAGWTVAETKKALAAIGAVEVDLDGMPGVVAPDDTAPVEAPDPWVALLPALDPATMGWTDRAWYLGDHAKALFDRSGNAGPTVWCDGRTVGAWAQQPNGDIVTELLEDVGKQRVKAIDRAVEALRVALGERRFVPRFTSPLERDLRLR